MRMRTIDFRKALNPLAWVKHRDRLLPGVRRAWNILVVDPLLASLTRVGLPVTRRDRFLTKLRNRHHGLSAFVIGNGPSLTIRDLELLDGHLTFGCNRIYVCFNETQWRPHYIVTADDRVAGEYGHEMTSFGVPVFLEDWICDAIQDTSRFVPVRTLARLPPPHVGFSSDALRGTFNGWVTPFFALQLARHMGVRTVYLLGMDFRYSQPMQSDSNLTEAWASRHAVVETSDGSNHFHPAYSPKGYRMNAADFRKQHLAFATAKEAYEASGCRILNASRDTALELFPRITLEDALADCANEPRIPPLTP